jgi:opacity protein-like surface antigen
MKRLAFAAVLVLCIASLSLAADEFPKVEVFAGYSLLRADTGLDGAEDLEGFSEVLPDIGEVTISNVETSKLLKKGFAASFTYNATSILGIEAAFRYNTGDVMNFDLDFDEGPIAAAALKLSDFSFGVGPKFTFRNSSPVTPFAHVLFGIDKMTMDIEASAEGESEEVELLKDTGYGITLGGGIDVKVNNNFAIRLIQADYYMTRHDETTQNNIALSFGVVFGFGQ